MTSRPDREESGSTAASVRLPPPRLTMPAQLYGREDAISTLRACLERTSQGQSEVAVVVGPTGSGKTALAYHLERTAAPDVVFGVGRFDPLRDHVPYDGVIQAFRGLIGSIDDGAVALAREHVRQAVGSHGGLLLDLIPELSRFLGKQAPATKVSLEGAHQRFLHAFRMLTAALGNLDRALVLVLDDLHAASADSIALVEALAADPEGRRVLFICNVRTHAHIDGASPSGFVLRLTKAGGFTTAVSLSPLDDDATTELLADMLARPLSVVRELAELVRARAAGCPRLITEILRVCERTSVIAYDEGEAAWRVELAKTSSFEFALQLERASAITLAPFDKRGQEILVYAVMLGPRVELEMLARVSDETLATTLKVMERACRLWMFVPLIDAFALGNGREEAVRSSRGAFFRVGDDAALRALLAQEREERRHELHAHIGRVLWEHSDDVARRARMFTVLQHRNRAQDLVLGSDERVALAERNLEAAERAASCGAMASAHALYEAGLALLPDNAWREGGELALALSLGAARAARGRGDLVRASALLDSIVEETNDPLVEAEAVVERGRVFAAHGHHEQALAQMLEALALLGVRIDRRATRGRLLWSLYAVWRKLRGKSFDDIVALPVTNDRRAVLLGHAVAWLGEPSYATDTSLTAVVIMRALERMLKDGIGPGGSMQIVAFGIIVAYALHDPLRGEELGRGALALEERFSMSETAARGKFVYAITLAFLRGAYREKLHLFDEAHRTATELGDVDYLANTSSARVMARIFVGHALDECAALAADSIETSRRLGRDDTRRISVAYRQLCRALQQRTASPGTFDDDTFDEAVFLDELATNESRIPIMVHGALKSFALLVANDIPGARAMSDKIAGEAERVLFGTLNLVDFVTRRALILACALEEAPAAERASIAAALHKQLLRMRRWTAGAPQNFGHRVSLIEAVLLAHNGEMARALERFESSIQAAAREGFVHDEALAAERAGRALLARARAVGNGDEPALAFDYLHRAREAYARWGADGKRAALDAELPLLAARSRRAPRTSALPTKALALQSRLPEAAATAPVPPAPRVRTTAPAPKAGSAAGERLIRATQALSGEMLLDELMRRVMTLVLESSGAERAALLLMKRGDLRLEAYATASGTIELMSDALEGSVPLAVPLVSQALRTLETVIVDDASVDDELRLDAHVQGENVRAVMCAPLVAQGRPFGAIYLEHRGAPRVFTDDRVELLHVLCGQIVISIENASLYRDLKTANASLERFHLALEEKVAARTSELEVMQNRLLDLERERAEARMAGGFAHEMRNSLVAAQTYLSRALGDPTTDEASLPHKTSDELLRMLVLARPSLSADVLHDVAQRASRVARNEELVDEVLIGSTKAVERSLKITRQIMAFSKVGQRRAFVERCRVKDVVDAAVAAEAARMEAHRIDVRVEANPDVIVTLAEDDVRAVVGNLLENAVDAVIQRPEGATRSVELSVSLDGDTAVLRVKDTGTGIAEEHRPRIFDPFFSTKPETGTGLGLGMVKRILGVCGGTIDFTTDVDVGTTFEVRVPRTRQRGMIG